jgi:uncharacterized cupredoxin-like copper-binding protein
MKRLSILVAVVALIALVAAACGGDDDDTAASGDSRTIEVEMVDIAFDPDSIDVERGETIRFVFSNTGAVAHDAFIGDENAQDDHESEMGAEMQHGNEDEDAITVDPGDEGELTYTFDDAGTILVGCHQPGHYEAGMVIEVNVS